MTVEKNDWWGLTIGRFIEEYPFYLPFVHITAVSLVDNGYLGCIAWTGDCLSLHINVPEASKLPVRQLQGLVEHEYAHYFLQHLSRRRREKLRGLIVSRSKSPEKKIRELMNILFDMEINTIIGKANLPQNGVFAEDYGLPPGLTAEEYLALIPPDDLDEIMEEKSEQMDIGDSGDPSGDCECDGPGDDSGEPSNDGTKPISDLKKFMTPDKLDIRLDGKPLDELDDQQLQERLERAAIEARKGRGSSPGGWDRLLAKLSPPKLKWPGVFRQMTTAYLKSNNYTPTWSRPNRRNPLLPGKQYKAKPSVFVLQDTSGSVSDRELAALASEIKGLTKYTSEIWLGVVDAAVHDFYKFTGKLQPMGGGGGSDFTPGFEKIWEKTKNKSTKPVIILLTDGDICVPDDPKGARVFWVLCNGPRQVPYGQTIVLGE